MKYIKIKLVSNGWNLVKILELKLKQRRANQAGFKIIKIRIKPRKFTKTTSRKFRGFCEKYLSDDLGKKQIAYDIRKIISGSVNSLSIDKSKRKYLLTL